MGLVFTKPIIETLYPRRAFADYTVPDPPPPCPVIDVLDFEVFPAYGVIMPLAAGTVITNQFAEWGISVETRRKTAPHYLTPGKPAMIFDSAHPTGGDFDLGTPNEQYPGGVGVSDDDINNPTLDHGASNDTARGNVLIISEDGDSGDPDDNETGGIILFKFDPPVAISEVGLLDQDDNWETGISGQAMVHNADGWSAEPIICLDAHTASTGITVVLVADRETASPRVMVRGCPGRKSGSR